MKLNTTVTIFVTSLILGYVSSAEEQNVENVKKSSRTSRQTNADQMVQNILRWLQGVYTQQSRRSRSYNDQLDFAFPNSHNLSPKIDIDAFRQGTLREYLPPSNTQKPRPFEPRPSGDGTDEEGNFIDGGYPPAGSITPQPPFSIDTQPPGGPNTRYPPTGPTVPGEDYGTSTIPPPSLPTKYPDGTTPGRPRYPTFQPGFTSYSTQTPGTFPPRIGITDRPKVTSTELPSETERTPYPTPGFPTYPPDSGYTERPRQPTETPRTYQPGITEESNPPTIHIPSERPGYSTSPPSGVTSERPGFPTQPPTYPTEQSGSTSPPGERPGYSTRPPPGYITEQTTEIPKDRPGFPTRPPPEHSPRTTAEEAFTSVPITLPPRIGYSTEGPEITERFKPTEGTPRGTTITPGDDDSRHPPHIHEISVDCAKDMMTIHLEFNREFNGIIYSKGYYHMPECKYVNENSGQKKFTFTVNLNMCGTEFINAFDSQNQSYLENVLVLQNEVGIQEIWDTVRAVRCLWEGNLKEQLSVSLMVGMLTQEIVTFSGDTAMAKLDIVTGRGPFGSPANGSTARFIFDMVKGWGPYGQSVGKLVKIGEPMTLVVSVSGDPGFDIQVKDCRATDMSATNLVQLTDEEGCILKSKLFGAFQKTRNTENTGASIIAYAYFNAFKFPDVMDLMIECNIELCKTDCNICTNPNQSLEPSKRRKRDVNAVNETLHNAVVMGKHLRVVLAEDLAATKAIYDNVCMSTQNFLLSSCILISLLTVSCLLCITMWFKMKRLQMKH